MKNVIAGLGTATLLLIGFCLPFAAEGGRLAVLLQPLPVFSLLFMTYAFYSFNFGFAVALRKLGHLLLFKNNTRTTESEELEYTVIFLCLLAATHITAIGYWLLILQHIASEKAILGHLFAATIITYLYGLILLTLVPANKTDHLSKIFGLAITAILAFAASAVAFLYAN